MKWLHISPFQTNLGALRFFFKYPEITSRMIILLIFGYYRIGFRLKLLSTGFTTEWHLPQGAIDIVNQNQNTANFSFF